MPGSPKRSRKPCNTVQASPPCPPSLLLQTTHGAYLQICPPRGSPLHWIVRGGCDCAVRICTLYSHYVLILYTCIAPGSTSAYFIYIFIYMCIPIHVWESLIPHTYSHTLFTGRAKGVPFRVFDQGVCNACWAFATVGLLQALLFIGTGIQQSLAVQDLMDCCNLPTCWVGNTGCAGGQACGMSCWGRSTGWLHDVDIPATYALHQQHKCIHGFFITL